MKLLIVGSLNSHAGKFAPFIVEQADALRAAGCEIEYYGVTRKGIWGYLRSVFELRAKIEEVRPDVVHAHFGLSGLMCCLQRLVPVVVTYHGSDINLPKNLRLSKLAMRLAAWNIFVSQRTMEIALGGKSEEVRGKREEVRGKSEEQIEDRKIEDRKIELLPGCYVAESREPEELAELLGKALAFGQRTEGRELIEDAGLRNEDVAEKLLSIYQAVRKEKGDTGK